MSPSFNPHNNPMRQVLWSLLIDMATKAQSRAGNLLGSHCKWGKQNMKMVPKAPATKLLVLSLGPKWGAEPVLTQIHGRSLRTSLVHDGHWTPIHLFPSSLASSLQKVFSFPSQTVSTNHVLLQWISRPKREISYPSRKPSHRWTAPHRAQKEGHPASWSLHSRAPG